MMEHARSAPGGARLTYLMLASLDGYVADVEGKFDRGRIHRRTRIERDFDAGAVRELKKRATKDVAIGGPELAASAFAAGLIDECHLVIAPIVVGAGKEWLPKNLRLALDLLDERRFASGMVYLHYRCLAPNH